MMTKITLRDLLEGHPPVDKIQWRSNAPKEREDEEPDGIFCGYCAWDGEKLISLDGDYYSLNAEVYRYEWEKDGSLTYWERVEWI